ncbi:MAG: DUF2029 domain-containing protein [Flavobacteriales bacterium]|nr:DUF2029 domain-containing protein [Flavobacteriales bacterium]
MEQLAAFLHVAWNKIWVKWLCAGVVFIFILTEAFGGRNDLDIFLSASRDLFAGENIYQKTYFDGYHYYYSVLFATIIYPLTSLGMFWSKLVWMLINLAMLARIWNVVLSWLGHSLKSPTHRTLLGFLILIFCLRFIKSNLHLCQMTIIMLYLSLESLNCIVKKRWIVGALLLAFAINIKLMPLVLIPYLFYRAQWKSALLSVVFVIVFLFLPSLWIGKVQNHFLLGEYSQLINPSQKTHVLDASETSFHSLTTFCAVFFTSEAHENGAPAFPRHVASLSVEQLNVLINALRLILVLLTLWFLRTWPFRKFQSNEKTWWEFSYLMLVVPLIFPHQQHYAFLMCLPSITWILFYIIKYRTALRTSLVMSLMFIYLSFNLSLLFGTWNMWYNHFKLVTFGSIVLLLCFMFLVPKAEASVLEADNQGV